MFIFFFMFLRAEECLTLAPPPAAHPTPHLTRRWQIDGLLGWMSSVVHRPGFGQPKGSVGEGGGDGGGDGERISPGSGTAAAAEGGAPPSEAVRTAEGEKALASLEASPKTETGSQARLEDRPLELFSSLSPKSGSATGPSRSQSHTTPL